MASSFALPPFLERFKADWFPGRTDSHLNDVCIEYPEEDIRSSTKNFDPGGLLGSGTFGGVYKGVMRDGTEVAIKVLQVPEEAGFEEEVKVLSRFRHPNLVILMGFSRHWDTGGRSLIYEYLAGGDVSKRLHKSRQGVDLFEANMRLSAALDAASGLSHLHNASPRAFHRDIKGPNILLDKNGTAKMADFGLACVSASSQHKVAQASGTVGYACPEYIRTGVISEGSEVHSFGMVLLELLTGAPPAVQRHDKPNEFCYLVDHLQGSLQKVVQMLDPSARFPPSLAQLLAEIAFQCINPVPANRPLFVHLVEDLRRLHSQVGKEAPPQQPVAMVSQTATMQRGRSPGRQSGLSLGQVVEAKWRGGQDWRRGRVLRANGNSTYGIKYDDGEFEDNVPVHLLRIGEPAQLLQQEQEVLARRPSRPHPESVFTTTVHGGTGVLAISSRHTDVRVERSVPRESQIGALAAGATERQGQQSSCRLWCVFGEGVDVSKLQDSDRSINFPGGLAELAVGRMAQPPSLWDALVPDGRLKGTISREHFKLFRKDQSIGLFCNSLNGLQLNGSFVRQGGERRLQHGDTIAFAASTDTAPTHLPRKPFVVFNVELPEAPHREVHSRPPDGTSPGKWHNSDIITGTSPLDAIFCLEVHGENVRSDLMSEARQLYFCADGVTSPALRVGRYYQQTFWRRVLNPNFYALGSWAFVATDHFEIISHRRAVSVEGSEWTSRLRVLSSAGLAVNYTTTLVAGDEHLLSPSDTLTVDAPSCGSGGPRGLHFTFIPFELALDSHLVEDNGFGPSTYDVSTSSSQSSAIAMPVRTVGALMAPVQLAELEDQTPHGSGGAAATRKFNSIEDTDLADVDDLFARTGFES